MTKRLSILFIFLLLFQSTSSGLLIPQQTLAQGFNENESVFTNISFIDEDGNEINIDQADSGSLVNVHVDWSIAHLEIEDEVSESFLLPTELDLESDQEGTLTTDELEVGTFQARKDGLVSVFFNESVTEDPEASGSFLIKTVVAGENEKEPDIDTDEEKINVDADEEKVDADADEEETDADEDETVDIEETARANDGTTSEEPVVQPLKDLGNIFEFEYFQKDGVDVEDGHEIDFDADYSLQYKWDTEGLEAKAGDTATLPLPDVFKHWPDTAPKLPIETSGQIVGTYTVRNGELKFTFNEAIESGDVHNGVVGLALQFDPEKFVEEWEQEIDFDGDGEKDLIVVVEPGEVETKLEKQGHADSDKNAKEITWSVDVTNGSDEEIVDGVLRDLLPEGVGEARDFVVKELTYDFEGNKVVGEEVSFNEPTVDGQGFEMTFDSIPARGGYRVEYTTTITDYEISQFTNDVTFIYGENKLETDSTVYTGERSNPIQKSGNYNYNTGQIDWTIIVNENGMEIENAIVHDQLPEELTLVEGSIEVKKNWQVMEDFNPTGFPIELGQVNADEFFEINFSTEIDWTKVNDGNYQQENHFINKTNLTDGEDPIGEDDAEVNIWRENLVTKSGNAADYDYENKILSWTIDVNKAKHPINQAVITDILPAGLEITESDIKIANEAGESVSAENITITTLDDGRQEVKIELGDIGTESLKVTYQTEVTDFELDSFTNEAILDGGGIGEDSPNTGETTIQPPKNEYSKHFSGIDYNEKTMDWNIVVDPTKEAIKELEIKDTFPNNGMILLPESVVVKIGDVELVKDTDYTLVANTVGEETGYDKGFTIQLTNINEDSPLNERLTVDFKTSYDPQLEVDGETLDEHIGDPTHYINQADFSGKTINDHEIEEDDQDDTYVREDSWNSGKKEGQLVHVDEEGQLINGWESGAERKVAWQLYTNYQKQNLGKGVVIKDTLDYEGTIDEDSIVVSVYDVDKDGNTTITDAQITDYEVDVNGNEFTLTFDEDFVVDERYVVEFTTTVPDISQENYKNDAKVIVDGKEYPYSGSVNYDEWNDYLDKRALDQEGNEVLIGEELEWEVTVNQNLSIIKNATIKDTISAGLAFVEDSLEIKTASGDELVEGEDYTLEATPTDNGETVLDVIFTNDVTETLTLNYTTVVVAENGQQVNNKVELNGDGFENKSKETDRLTAKQFSWVGGDYNPGRGAIEISKIDSITGEVIADSEAIFELYRVVNDENVLMGEFTTENGVLEVANLFLGTYILKEIKAPEGYRLSEEELIIVVDKAYGTDKIVFKDEFNNISDTAIDIPVQKIWEDAENQDGVRPEFIEVKLLANENETDFDNLILNADNNWQGAFTGLPVLDADGEPIEYSIAELDVENGYTSEVSDNDEGGFVVTNSREPERTEISGEKIWDDADNQDGVRPERITVNLLANGKKVSEQVVTADDNWNYVFEGLPKFEAGEEITYTVTENNVEGYTTNIAGYDITNSYTPGERNVTVTKAWEDANNQDGKRPESIEVQLYANGDEYGEPVVLSDENDWTHTWTKLAVNEPVGDEIEYKVKELSSHEDYDVDINDEDLGNVIITNSYTPEVTEISGEKIWDDADNQDGIRPEKIIVNLLADETVIDSKEVRADDNWSYTFADLPVYQPGEVGQEIEYKVIEAEVPEGYEVDYDGNNIINSYDPELAEVSVTKEWNDEDDLAGFRPDHIEVELYADGEATGKIIAIVADEDGNWEGSFINLPKYRDEGIQIDYTVKEVSLDENLYSVDIIPSDEDLYDFTLINTHEVERINLTGAKTWDDADNQDGVRPDSITVRLLANGKEVESIVVTNETDWEFEFTNLPKYQNGEEITYTIQEDKVEGYSTEITGMNIVNSYTPEQTSINVVKAWDDAGNQDGLRPESITVKLLANGEDTGKTIELNATNNWQGDFTKLDIYANGEKIEYTIEEEAVEGYEVDQTGTAEDGFVLTNIHEPEMINLSGTKTWDDADNQDGKRPESITVRLLANGEEIDHVNVTAEDEWQYSFTNLPKFQNGEEITYTITEDPVEGYESVVDGYDITNTLESEKEDPTDSTDESDDPNVDQGDQLPKTATNTYNIIFAGVGLLILGAIFFLINHRRKTIK